MNDIDTERRGGLHPDLLHGALSCLLWQGNESSDDPNDKRNIQGASYSGDPEDIGVIPAGVQAEVINALVVFMIHAQGLLDQIEREHDETDNVWSNPAQVGHDWVLTSFDHGTGFWDRYWGDHPLASVGDILASLAKDYPCPEYVTFQLYVDDDGRQVWFEA